MAATRKTGSEIYNDALDAYISNKPYNDMQGSVLKQYVEQLGKGIGASNNKGFVPGTGPLIGKSKAAVKNKVTLVLT